MSREVLGIRTIRMRLRRYDRLVYLDRWGVQVPWLGGLLLHRMDAPDPGLDVHDHPWAFVTIPILGGYDELRADVRAPLEQHVEVRRPWRPRLLRLDEAHRITTLHRARVWTVCVHGPKRRPWGFYVPDPPSRYANRPLWLWMVERTYDETIRADRADLWNEDTATGRPESNWKGPDA